LYSAFVVLFQTQAHFNPLLAFYFSPYYFGICGIL